LIDGVKRKQQTIMKLSSKVFDSGEYQVPPMKKPEDDAHLKYQAEQEAILEKM